ncbi:LysR substrate-binding domain-containing protein [Pelagovum pacificum]|uniref:LysR family transcriptional regulator n=1 Tax=Pelagovum pacificum TaxID=2588711 RepID=A0A5C5G9Q4_9RHOB|nr:LysR substrate-binding domain-containing protein [Pelagovum pacificum]QQA42405.1 LysR family transcriptional regulator [Pelagovum pacificum]TNY31488.1 LysR family transcriptional regulator [Pelagovum pacificum]
MTLEQLRIFLAVAEREHVTRAAESLNLTQSAVSAAISALEARHGVKLFDRIGRRIFLTDAGRGFIGEARAVLGRAALAARMLEDTAELARGHLRIAASQTVANDWLPARLARYRKSYPGIELHVRIGNSVSAATAVSRLEADLAVIEDHAGDETLEETLLTKDAMQLVVAADSDGAALADPLAADWVLRETGSGTRAVFDAWLAGRGVDADALRNPLILPSNEAVRAAVEAGAGASILSEMVVGRSIDAGLIRALPAELPHRHFRLLRHRERPFTRAEAAFAALASDG